MKILQDSLQQFDFAVIFDMDGVIVDNTKYHTLALQAFLKQHGKNITVREMKKKVLGRFNKEIFEDIFKRSLTKIEGDFVQKPSVQTVAKIAKVLGVSVEDLLK